MFKFCTGVCNAALIIIDNGLILCRCDRAALFLPFAFGVPLTIIPEIVMGVRYVLQADWQDYIHFPLRVVALYEKNKFVMIGLATYLIAELGTGLWIYSVPGSHRMFHFLKYLENVLSTQYASSTLANKRTWRCFSWYVTNII